MRREKKKGFLSSLFYPISTYFFSKPEDELNNPPNRYQNDIFSTSEEDSNTMPPPLSPYRREKLFVVQEQCTSPSPLKWGVYGTSLENYYFDETGDSNEVSDKILRNWARKGNVFRALQAQRFVDPDDIFGDNGTITIDINELFQPVEPFIYSPTMQGFSKEEILNYNKEMGYM